MENDIQYKSRTQIKKDAEELQKLGEELTKLSTDQLKRMDIPNDLREALIEARSIKSHIAGRRQRQFLGTLMRDVDPEPIRHALLRIDAGRPIESETAKETRMWLDRTATGDPAAIEEFLSACPGADRQKLRQLLRNINKEQTPAKTSKSLKALKQYITENIKNK